MIYLVAALVVVFVLTALPVADADNSVVRGNWHDDHFGESE